MRRSRRVGCLGTALLILYAVLPQISTAAPPPTPGVAWQTTFPVQGFLSAPAVGPDGRVYVASGDGWLYSLTAQGALAWRTHVGSTLAPVPATRPVIDATGTSYWTIGGGVAALDRSGHVRWYFLASGGTSPLLWHDRVLFTAGPYLYAIATSGPQAGSALWRAAIGTAAPPSGGASPVVLGDGSTLVPSTDGHLYAIDAQGHRRWRYTAPGSAAVLYTPAVSPQGTIYVDSFANGQGTLSALGSSGHLLWRLHVPVGSNVAVGNDGTIYLASHLLLAISVRGHLLWQHVVEATTAPGTFAGGVVVSTLLPPALKAYAPDGRALWTVPLTMSTAAPFELSSAGRVLIEEGGAQLAAIDAHLSGATARRQLSTVSAPAVTLGGSNPPFQVSRGRIRWRVTMERNVERSDDNGRHWVRVLTPGQSTPSSGAGPYHNARYASITGLVLDPFTATGLYVSTLGMVGDYLTGGAGGADGGLYYATNGRDHWVHLSNGLPYTYEPRLRVSTYGLDAVVVDPQHRGRLYALTATEYGAPGHDGGLYRSVDGGKHWQIAMHGVTLQAQLNRLLGGYHALPQATLLLDRSQTEVAYLIAGTGLYRSSNGCLSWSAVRGVSYTDPSTVAVRIGTHGMVGIYDDHGYFESHDGGQRFKGPLPPPQIS